ncbi:MAG: non-canonical purine NTP pyrophosphatase [Nanoarchaeota archaeon]|nr:non-canonical purine NTP pyrophosphatase [Nanoarchaeota archaeon]
MKKVYFATGNKGKYGTLKDVLKQYGLKLIHQPMNFDKELDSEHLDEIAVDKVIRAYEKLKKPVISLDAGFYVKSLNGKPGAKINPFLKEHGIEGILKLLEGKGRFCEFKQCLAYMGPDISYPKIFESDVKGMISEEAMGCIESKPAWSKLWLIFIPEGEVKTIAEMDKKEYKVWRAKRGKDSIGAKFGTWYSFKKIKN